MRDDEAKRLEARAQRDPEFRSKLEADPAAAEEELGRTLSDDELAQVTGGLGSLDYGRDTGEARPPK